MRENVTKHRVNEVWRIVTVFLVIVMLACATGGCAAAWFGADTAKQDKKISMDFTQVPGEENLYYCNDTMIVYWIGGSYKNNILGSDYTTSYMTVYYAPDGWPYRYDIETGNFETTGGKDG